MTFYDFRVFDNADQKVHLTGMYTCVQALRYLDSAAQHGLLSTETVVKLWSDIPVPGAVLRGLLGELRQDAAWVVDDRTYTVTLDEF